MTQKTDKFLIGIVAGVLLLVIVAFVVVLTRSEPTYQSDDTPSGVAHNYLLAFQRKEYDRAYRYLAPEIAGYPTTVETFRDDVQDNRWLFGLDEDSVALEVVSADLNSNRADITIRKTTFYQGDLFSDGQSTRTFTMQLERNLQTDVWQIVDSGDYWLYCWSDEDGCK